MRRFFCIALFFLLSIPISSQNLLERGERFFREGNYSLALEAFDSFLRTQPNSPRIADVQFRRAQSLFYPKRYREAYELFQRIEIRYPSTQYYPLLPFWAGLTAFSLKDYDTAIALLNRYIKSAPTEEGRRRALLYLAYAYKENGQLSLAHTTIASFFEGTSLGPPDPQALLLYAELSHTLGELEGIINLYRKGSINNLQEPRRSKFLLAVGEALFKLRSFQEAQEVFSLVSSQLPEEKTHSYLRILQGYAELQKPEEIPPVLEKAKEELQDLTFISRIWE
ncbi:MAG: tetratricopeptide repeat protein, partial [Spirochaetales bacterium]